MMKKRVFALLLAVTCTGSAALPALATPSAQSTPPSETYTTETQQIDATYPPALEDDPMVYRLQQQHDEETDNNNPMSSLEKANGSIPKTSQYSFLTQKTYQVPKGYNIFHGIDVSYYNGAIQWKTIQNAGIDFAFIRVGYRGYGSSGNLASDPQFDTYMKGATQANMPIGVYIFSQALTPKEAIEEANFVLQKIKNYPITLPIVMDYEFYGDDGRLYDAHLSKAQMTDNALAFCDTIKKAGYTPMLYANKSFLESNIYASKIEKVAKIWLANYTTNTKYAGEYDYWQYSETGSVNGIASKWVDSNFFFTKGDLDGSNPNIVNGFTDVLSSSWYAESVSFVSDHDIMSGLSPTKFAPTKALTREMIAQILYNLVDKPNVSYSKIFSDVPAGQWYTNAIMWAKKNGIMAGTSSTTFGVKKPITREQIATTLYSFSKKYGVSISKTQSLSSYKDASTITSYAVTPMKWAVANKILSGRTSNTLVPKGSTTRAECATILKSYLSGIASKFL